MRKTLKRSHGTATMLGAASAAAALALSLAAVPTAGAAARPRGDNALASSPVRTTWFAGYSSQPKALRSAFASVTVPALTKCPPSAPDSGLAPMVDLGGYKYFVSALILVECNDGTVRYQVQINDNGTARSYFSVSPNDVVTLYVSMEGKTAVVTIDDLTSHRKLQKGEPAKAVDYAYIGDDTLVNGGRTLPLAPFGAQRFTSVKLNGAPLGRAAALTKEILVNGARVLMGPSALVAGGTAFTIFFKASK